MTPKTRHRAELWRETRHRQTRLPIGPGGEVAAGNPATTSTRTPSPPTYPPTTPSPRQTTRDSDPSPGLAHPEPTAATSNFLLWDLAYTELYFALHRVARIRRGRAQDAPSTPTPSATDVSAAARDRPHRDLARLVVFQSSSRAGDSPMYVYTARVTIRQQSPTHRILPPFAPSRRSAARVAPSSSHRRALDRYEPGAATERARFFPFVSSSSHRRRNAHTDTRDDARARPGAAQRSLGDRLRGGARAVPRARRSRDRSIVEQCVTMRNRSRARSRRGSEGGDVARDVASARDGRRADRSSIS